MWNKNRKTDNVERGTTCSTKKDKSDKSKGENATDRKRKKLIILGDSMIKYVNGWGISCKLQSDCKVHVQNFS